MKRQCDIERKRNFLIIICMIVLLMSGCQSIAKQEETQGTEASIDAPTVWVTEEPTEESAEEATGESVPDGEEEPPYSVGKGSLFTDLPLFTYANFVEHRNMGGAEMLMFSQALTNAGYYQYGTLLEEVGFTCYAENEIEENLFSTWVRDEVVLTAIYINDYTKVHLIAEENVSLPGLPEENVYEEWDIDNLVVQISADYDGQTSNGLCYIYRLCDGSFIIVDFKNLDETGTNIESLFDRAANSGIKIWAQNETVDHNFDVVANVFVELWEFVKCVNNAVDADT